MTRHGFRRAALAGLLGAIAVTAEAMPPVVRFVTVSDVTPRSFRVVWLVGEPSVPEVQVYEAPACTTEVFSAEVSPFPTVSGRTSLAAAARQKGVMVVLIAGLTPDTSYCVRTRTTSLLSSEQRLAPEGFLVVRTEKATTRARAGTGPAAVAFSNDLARFVLPGSGGSASTEGMVVLLSVQGSSSPLSAFVGDGIDSDGNPATPTTLALVDLNNLYSAVSHESLDITGQAPEEISARVLGGADGLVTVHARLVPADAGRNEVVTPGSCRNAGTTACDGRVGDANGDNTVSVADADAVRALVVGQAPLLPCMVCADATWDFGRDMKDALAIGQAAVGLRRLPW